MNTSLISDPHTTPLVYVDLGLRAISSSDALYIKYTDPEDTILCFTHPLISVTIIAAATTPFDKSEALELYLTLTKDK